METNGIQAGLTKILLQEGASAFGYAEISSLPAEIRYGLNYAVSIVTALDAAIVGRIGGGPDHAYYGEYRRANTLLARLGRHGARFLEEHGYTAMPLPPTGEGFDHHTLSIALPHKTVATRTGIGWIVKSALLITEQYGASIRLSTILTDAVLETAAPVNVSRCGDCAACVKKCPGRRSWAATGRPA